jgi:hypothetical protein
VVLNQVVRPFTAKWHSLSISHAFSDKEKCREFRHELTVLQSKLRAYTQMLAYMAGVEDLTELEIQPEVAPASTAEKPYDLYQYIKYHTQTVNVSACKSCNKPFSIKRKPVTKDTKHVVVDCPFCHMLLRYRKRIYADKSTDMNHVAEIS